MVTKAQIIEIDWQKLKESINNSEYSKRLSPSEVVCLCNDIHKANPIRITEVTIKD